MTIGLLIAGSSFWADAQTEELSLEEQLAQLELDLDSLTIFNLIDSILTTPAKSEFGVRLGYSSSRLSAGRDFNLNQQGYMPAFSYYHKSGAYADWTTYFDNQSESAINLSILHLGYMYLPNSKWMINPYVERTFNHQATTNELNQSIGAGVTRDFKIVELSLDYAFLWGKSTGHRLLPGLTKSFSLKNVPLVKELRLYPNISLMAGTTTIFNYLYSDDQIENYLREIQYLSDDEIRALRVSGQITTEQARNLVLTRRLLNSDDPDAIDLVKDWLNILEEDAAFALLSINFSLPVSFDIQRTFVMMSYSYSIPQRLPGEDLGLDPSGFFSLTVSRRFTF